MTAAEIIDEALDGLADDEAAEQARQARDLLEARDSAYTEGLARAVAAARRATDKADGDARQALEDCIGDPSIGIEKLWVLWCAVRQSAQIAQAANDWGHPDRAIRRGLYPAAGIAAVTFAEVAERAIQRRTDLAVGSARASLNSAATEAANAAMAKVKA